LTFFPPVKVIFISIFLSFGQIYYTLSANKGRGHGDFQNNFM